ncbi:hypothetical protein M5K25_003804 [Dendrobium thyrsiflorum]|uniref:SWIM-type domain-containing protein n=1 Tax=Dendrobium thyrsiflorum TaxID=117978 RepID=A0ABD0VKY5_DENTH
MSRFILFFDGELQLAEDFTPTYIGGRNRPLQINNMITLEELKLRIIRALHRDCTGYTVYLACRLRNNGGHTVVRITDDEVCTFILVEARRRTVIVYVEFEELPRASTQHDSPPPLLFENPRHSTYIPRSTPIVNDPPSLHRMSVASRPTFDLNIPILTGASPSVMENIGECDIRDSHRSPHPSVEVPMEAYETMDSDTSENSSEEPDVPPAQVPMEDFADPLVAHQIIQNHSVENVQNLEDMIANNEYVQNICTPEDWDASDGVDDPIHHHQEFFDAIIPDQLYEGMTFGSKEALQCALTGWSLKNNVQYKKSCSNKQRLTVICVQQEKQRRPCLWRLHAARSKRLGGLWKISSISGRHTCTHPVMAGSHQNCTSKFICQYITAALRKELDLKPREIITRINAKFDVQVSYMKAWDARRKAIQSIFGSYEESYTSLYRMMEAIRVAIPGSVYNIEVIQDGTFLVGKYRGTLLAAVGVDGNGGLFPFAFAVVEAETIDSWTWFLRNMRDLIIITTSRLDLCIISDKHAGLVRGCNEIFPWAAHRHCLRHLRENFRKALRRWVVPDCDAVCDRMYWAGSTDEKAVHNRHMMDIHNIKKEAYDWLVERDICKWTLTHDGGFRYGVMTTNSLECFNGILRRARGLPIQGLIMTIYYNLVSLFMKRKSKVESWIAADSSTLVPRTKAVLELAERKARRSPQPTQINSHEFEVFDMTCRSFRVLITSPQTCTCSCGHPEIYHTPCQHVIIALGSRHWDHNSFVSPYFTLAFYKQSYSGLFHVIPERSQWPPYNVDQGIIPLLAPAFRRRSGRPRTNRYRNRIAELCESSTHLDPKAIRSYVDEEGLNDDGWKYVQSKGMEMFGHIAPMKILKTRHAETRRCQDGSVEVIVDNPTADISHCILYRKWDSAADAFLVKTYENLIYWPGKKRKEFLDASDWQCVQQWFQHRFGCCPTQTQLQARTRIVLNKH